MMFIKEESEDMKIEETFRVKHEDTETQTKMMFIKEESEDMKIEEAFRVKHEDTEEQTGWFSFSELTHLPLLNKNAMQCKNENKKMAEKSLYDNSVNTLRTTVINHKDFNLSSAYVYGLRSVFCSIEQTNFQRSNQFSKDEIKTRPLISDAVSLG